MTSQINLKQPRSIPSNHPNVWELVQKDLAERVEMGERKHGVKLQPFNGRDGLIDAYQEAMDLVMYLRQVIFERDGV